MCKLDHMRDIVWDRDAMRLVETEEVSKTVMHSALHNLAHGTNWNRTGLKSAAPESGRIADGSNRTGPFDNAHNRSTGNRKEHDG